VNGLNELSLTPYARHAPNASIPAIDRGQINQDVLTVAHFVVAYPQLREWVVALSPVSSPFSSLHFVHILIAQQTAHLEASRQVKVRTSVSTVRMYPETDTRFVASNRRIACTYIASA